MHVASWEPESTLSLRQCVGAPDGAFREASQAQGREDVHQDVNLLKFLKINDKIHLKYVKAIARL